MSEFYIGQKVQYIGPVQPVGTVTSGAKGEVSQLTSKDIYTVEWLGAADFTNEDGSITNIPALQLVGYRRQFRHQPKWNGHPWGYLSFRPIESKSIELFRRISQGVTDGKPIIADPEYKPHKEYEPVTIQKKPNGDWKIQ